MIDLYDSQYYRPVSGQVIGRLKIHLHILANVAEAVAPEAFNHQLLEPDVTAHLRRRRGFARVEDIFDGVRCHQNCLNAQCLPSIV